jgi:acetyl-CoA synthetase
MGFVQSSAGYLIYAMSTMKHIWHPNGLWQNMPVPKKNDVWFCTENLSSIMGHSYMTYAPLALGLVNVIYEGSPTYNDKIWEIIDRYQVTLFQTSSKVIHHFQTKKEKKLKNHTFSTLREIGYTTKTNDTNTRRWFLHYIGNDRCPLHIVYAYPETGGYLLTSFTKAEAPNISYLVPCLGLEPERKDNKLFIKKSFPGIARNYYKNHKEFYNKHLGQWPNKYFVEEDNSEK